MLLAYVVLRSQTQSKNINAKIRILLQSLITVTTPVYGGRLTVSLVRILNETKRWDAFISRQITSSGTRSQRFRRTSR